MAGARKGVWMEKVPRYVSSVLVVLKVFCSLFPSPLGSTCMGTCSLVAGLALIPAATDKPSPPSPRSLGFGAGSSSSWWGGGDLEQLPEWPTFLLDMGCVAGRDHQFGVMGSKGGPPRHVAPRMGQTVTLNSSDPTTQHKEEPGTSPAHVRAGRPGPAHTLCTEGDVKAGGKELCRPGPVPQHMELSCLSPALVCVLPDWFWRCWEAEHKLLCTDRFGVSCNSQA